MLVSIISPLSELRIERRFFCCIPYSLRNILVNFEIFSQPFGPVEHWFNMLCWAASVLENTSGCFSRFSLIRTRNHAPFFLLDSLFFKEYSVKISYFFLDRIDWSESGTAGSSGQLTWSPDFFVRLKFKSNLV